MYLFEASRCVGRTGGGPKTLQVGLSVKGQLAETESILAKKRKWLIQIEKKIDKHAKRLASPAVQVA